MNGALRRNNPTAYFIWVGIFFLMLITIVCTLYIATRQIDYVWRWYNMPKYFANEETVAIEASLEGSVASIVEKGDKAEIVIKGDDGETETFTVPTEDIRVYENDFVNPGDPLATYKEWRPGILAQGMWKYRIICLATMHLAPNQHVKELARLTLEKIEGSFGKANPLEKAIARGLHVTGRARQWRTEHFGDAIQPHTRLVRYNY